MVNRLSVKVSGPRSLVSGGFDCRGWAAVADCRWGVFQQPAKNQVVGRVEF